MCTPPLPVVLCPLDHAVELLVVRQVVFRHLHTEPRRQVPRRYAPVAAPCCHCVAERDCQPHVFGAPDPNQVAYVSLLTPVSFVTC